MSTLKPMKNTDRIAATILNKLMDEILSSGYIKRCLKGNGHRMLSLIKQR